MFDWRKLIVFLLVAILFDSCGSPRIISYFNEGTDFAQYHSYSIAGGEILAEEELSEEVRMRLNEINGAINDEMTERGYFQSEDGDMVVSIRRHLSPKVEYEQDRYAGRSIYSRRPYYSWSKKEFSEGKLIVEIRERQSDKFLWHGDLDLKINKRSRDKDKIIKESISLIFSEYPFEAGKSTPRILDENKE